jgi:hypothetical protein
MSESLMTLYAFGLRSDVCSRISFIFMKFIASSVGVFPRLRVRLYIRSLQTTVDRLCGLVVRVSGYRCNGLERSPLSLSNVTEELRT